MVQPIDIAQQVHNICERYLIPDGRSPDHELSQHAATTAIYAEAVNEAGLGHRSGWEVMQAIVEAANWDYDDSTKQWPGHPSTESVIHELRLL